MNRFLKFLMILIVPLVLSGCTVGVGIGGGKAKAPAQGQFVKGGVVKGFPDLPLYEKAQAVESYGSPTAFGASFIAKDSLAKVVNFYNTSLPQLGWQVNAAQKSTTNYLFDIKNETYTGSVVVNTAADGKSTAITMSVLAR